jgi:uncharacterized SAM-binding protein YcdF (DUF218 family)
MRFFLFILMAAALVWCGALVWFVHSMPTESAPASVRTDAIIVLTGGQGRVEHGLDMLAANAAPVLFISGVGPHVTRLQMLNQHASLPTREAILARQPEILFDYVAETTKTNAQQAAEFVHQRGIRSIRLVTANYHMPRSRLEFTAAMPGVEIVSDPVFPEGFRRDEWWRHDNTRRLVFSEFYKYFAALIRGLVA